MSNPSDHSFFYDEKTGHYSPPRTEGPTMSEDKKACSDTRCPMTRGGVCNVCGAEVPKGFGEPSLRHELVAALAMFLERVEKRGEWDDGCFYHNGTSASELEEPINKARAVLQKAKQGDKQ